jgi:hypothetical protein
VATFNGVAVVTTGTGNVTATGSGNVTGTSSAGILVFQSYSGVPTIVGNVTVGGTGTTSSNAFAIDAQISGAHNNGNIVITRSGTTWSCRRISSDRRTAFRNSS